MDLARICGKSNYYYEPYGRKKTKMHEAKAALSIGKHPFKISAARTLLKEVVGYQGKGITTYICTGGRTLITLPKNTGSTGEGAYHRGLMTGKEISTTTTLMIKERKRRLRSRLLESRQLRKRRKTT